MSLHSSDVSAFRQCARLQWYKHHQPQAFKPFVVVSQNLTSALIEKLGVDAYFRGHTGMDAQASMGALRTHEWLFNVRFEAHHLRVNVAGIHRSEAGLELYFTSLTPQARIEDAGKYAQTLWVLENLGYTITKVWVFHLNRDYVRTETLSLDCYRLTSEYQSAKGKVRGDILAIVREKKMPTQEEVQAVHANQNRQEPVAMTLRDCPNPIKCPYFTTCFKTEDLPLNALHYFSHPKRSAWLAQGYLQMSEVDLTSEELSALANAQLQAHQGGGRYVNQAGLKTWLDRVAKGPISFIDFEWDTYAQPPYKGMRPFDVVVFQFSLHILDGDQLQHIDYLGVEDCREAFINRLLEALPKTGTIFAFNAFGAEALRLKELALAFPHHQSAIENVLKRLDDLALVFNEGLVYDVHMKGALTLKRIHHVVNPTSSYQTLPIAHGLDAVYHYRSFDDADESLKEALLDYGRMDTQAMVDVYQWLERMS